MAFISTQAALERPAIIVPAALLLLAAAGGLIWTQISRQPAPQPLPQTIAPAPVSMLVASTDIVRGQVLTGRDFVLQPATSNSPATALHRAEDANTHVALEAIPAGKPILAAQVSLTASRGIAARVPEGYRAYALPVSEAVTAGGFVEAGDHVDLYLTLPGALFAETMGRKENDQSKSTLLLQDVAVLATGTKIAGDGKPDTSVRTATLAVKASDLARLSLANRLGAISLALRNPIDTQAQPEMPPAAMMSLLGEAAAAPQTRKAAARGGVPVLAGRERTTIFVPGGR